MWPLPIAAREALLDLPQRITAAVMDGKISYLQTTIAMNSGKTLPLQGSVAALGRW